MLDILDVTFCVTPVLIHYPNLKNKRMDVRLSTTNEARWPNRTTNSPLHQVSPLNVDKWRAVSHKALWLESIPERGRPSVTRERPLLSVRLGALRPRAAPSFIAHSIFSFILLFSFFVMLFFLSLLAVTQLIHGWMALGLAGRFLSLIDAGHFPSLKSARVYFVWSCQVSAVAIYPPALARSARF